jgi:hypothetical protein
MYGCIRRVLQPTRLSPRSSEALPAPLGICGPPITSPIQRLADRAQLTSCACDRAEVAVVPRGGAPERRMGGCLVTQEQLCLGLGSDGVVPVLSTRRQQAEHRFGS